MIGEEFSKVEIKCNSLKIISTRRFFISKISIQIDYIFREGNNFAHELMNFAFFFILKVLDG